MRINDALSTEEIRELIRPSDIRGLQAVLTTWAMIAGAFAWVAFDPSFISISAALVILGGRHLALGILMHDAAHYSLFKTRPLNDWIGGWVCAYPTWQDLRRYRGHHLDHHRFAGSERDPDLSLVSPFPISRRSLCRKFARDLSGISGFKRVYGLILMDLGFIRFTVANDMIRLDQKGRTKIQILKTAFRNLHGFLITNLLLFLILLACGHPALYLLWVASYLTTFSLFVRIRSIAEHACTQMDLDPLNSTRTTLANPLARITVAPIRVNFHLEHHLAMTIPYFNLPKSHRMLKQRGALNGAQIARGYFEILRIATTVRSR